MSLTPLCCYTIKKDPQKNSLEFLSFKLTKQEINYYTDL